MSEKTYAEMTHEERQADALKAVAAASETPEQKAAREQLAANEAQCLREAEELAAKKKLHDEKQARIEAERRAFVNSRFLEQHRDDYVHHDGDPNNAKGKTNERIMVAAMGDQPWTLENLNRVFQEQTAAGNLFPPAVRPAAPPPAPRVNTEGMTLAKFWAMSAPDSRAYYKSHKAIVDFLVEERNAGRS